MRSLTPIRAAIVTCTLLALAGCAHKPTLVGKWQGSTTTPQGGALSSTFEFTQDGKETISFQASGGPIAITMGGSGTYTTDGSNLTQNITSMSMGSMTIPVSPDKAQPQTSSYTLDGDHLTLTSPTSKQSLTLTRGKRVSGIRAFSAALLLLSVGSTLHADAPVPPAPRYTVSDLGPLPHVADEVNLKVNDAGQVAGWADVGGGMVHAALWTKGHADDLGTLPGFTSSLARGLNGRGQAVGWAVSGKNLVDSLSTTHACLFSDGKARDLGTLGGRDSQAFAINASGQIVGVSNVNGQVRHAFLWANGKMTDLGTLPGGQFSMAYDINNAGTITGIAETADHTLHGFLLSARRGRLEAMQDLGALPHERISLAYTLNNRGDVAGAAQSNGDYHAVVRAQNKWNDWGTLGSDPAAIYGLNDRSQYVGASNLATVLRHAFLIENGKMIDLNRWIAPSSDWTLISANSINNAGQIVCVARRATGPTHAVLLSPLSTSQTSP